MKERLVNFHVSSAKILHFPLQKADSPLGVFSSDVERGGQGSGHRADLMQVRQAEGHRLQGVHRQIQLVMQDRVAGSRCRTLQIGKRLNEGTRKIQRGDYFNRYVCTALQSLILW